MLMVVTQRFFCPALEVIADFLRMPPNVAGATLLSLGNGAPDFFTQIAAVAQVSPHTSTAADARLHFPTSDCQNNHRPHPIL